MDLLDKIVPPDDVLWYVLNSVLEIEPVTMSVKGTVVIVIEADSVNIITEGQFFCVW